MLPPVCLIAWLSVLFVKSCCPAYTYHVALPLSLSILNDADPDVGVEICEAAYHGFILVPSPTTLKAAYSMWKGDALWPIMQL
jgi:hypothetical protein